jgi:fibronectin-binding autotransporter adhesin
MIDDGNECDGCCMPIYRLASPEMRLKLNVHGVLMRQVFNRFDVRLVATFVAMPLVAASSPALAQCTTITGSVSGGCGVTAPSQVLTIQPGGTLNGWVNMTSTAPGAGLTVNAGGTLNSVHGAPPLNGVGQVTNTIAGLAGANQTLTNNGTIISNQNVLADLIGVDGNGFTITNNGQIINNNLVGVSNAISINTANVSGTINNHGLITAAGGGSEGTIYTPQAGGTLAINNFQGATIHSNSFIAVNIASNKTTTLRNAGTISTNSLVAPAIQFGTGDDTLILESSSVITGFVNGRGGVNTFALGGAADGSFDVSRIGAAAQYRNFQTFEKIESSTWTLTGTTAAVTPWTIFQGKLVVNGSVCGPMNVFAGGTLGGNGTVCDTTNAGTVAPGNSIGTLTIAGNYTGNGGTLAIESVLGGDASPSDRLVVTGNTAGATNVKVINLGGSGSPTTGGIKIVDVQGASNGTFALLGDYVFHGQQAAIGGAYAYTLQKNGIATPADGDWYLRSSLVNPPPPVAGPIYQPGVPLYEAYPQVLQALNNLPTLQQRVGNRYWGGDAARPATGDQPVHEQSVFWARTSGSYARTTASGSTTLSDTSIGQWSAHTGFDGLLHQNDNGIVVGGLTAHYGLASADVRSRYGDGRINATGWGIGSAITWYGANGFYVDGQAQITIFDSIFKSSLVGRDMAHDNGGFGYAFSAETGHRFNINGPWALTPQAQLIYSAVDADFADNFGARVVLDRSERLTGRLGAALDHQHIWRDDAGRLARANLYGVASVYYEFLDSTSVNVAELNFASSTERVAGGFGLGGTYNWGNDRYSVYGEALIKTGFDDDYSVGGTAGFRMKW